LLPALALALVPAAWLVANHYPPWVSAWLDGTALACLALAALAGRTGAEVPRAWMAAVLLALASVAWQWASGQLLFFGDALMVALYVGAFALAMALGASMAQPAAGSPPLAPPLAHDGVSIFALGVLAAALLSVAVALVQWTNVSLVRLWIAELPPWGRPFSNLAQPNHFSTACFLGFAALALLRENGRVGWLGFWCAAPFLALGAVMSGSRTAWLQLGLAAALCAWLGARTGLQVRWRQLAALALVGVALQAAWSPLDGLLDRHVDRPLEEKLAAGARPAIWRDMAAAIAREPLMGHGWMQIGAAQQSIALDRPPVPGLYEHFDHAHNVVLDLLLWAGVPVGTLIIALATLALWQQLRRLDDARAVWLFIGALAILVHALLEFPHTFAYFLLPLGVLLGMAHALSPGAPPVARWRWPRALLPVSGAALAALLSVVALDYLKAEENFRLARFEMARIGTDRVTSEVPPLRVLTQLEAYLRFVRTEPRAGLSAEELESMQHVARRHGFGFVLFRHAVALGLNGRPDEAARTLKLLCHVHSRKRCQETRDAWPAMQQRHEALRAIPPP